MTDDIRRVRGHLRVIPINQTGFEKPAVQRVPLTLGPDARFHRTPEEEIDMIDRIIDGTEHEDADRVLGIRLMQMETRLKADFPDRLAVRADAEKMLAVLRGVTALRAEIVKHDKALGSGNEVEFETARGWKHVADALDEALAPLRGK